ncbi:MAG: hypothetical protein D6806_06035 [Deltaproteobacteria bacterium]|nr:MAG: hypothetical protein D6806_06035 [Deltaproteobacteria bacterium]
MPAIILLLFAAALTSCTEHKQLEAELAGFDVEITVEGTGGDGTPAKPFDIPSGELTVHYTARAFDTRGMDLPFSGQVRIDAVPGEIVPQDPATADFSEGLLSGTLQVRKVFGRFALWVEDVRLEPSDVVRGATSMQLVRRTGSFATGVSNTVYFKKPTLAEIQYAPWLEAEANIDTSALPNEFVDIDCRAGDTAGPFAADGHGQLVVTGIFNEGFFVTDVAGGSDFDHLYVYTYSYPDELEIGDRLDRLVGSSQDFSGCTQISFPSWRRATDDKLDPEPFRVKDLDSLIPPVLVTTAMCSEGSTSNLHLCGHSKNNWTMERLESARVRLENLRTPDVYVDCDFNGDSEVVPDWLDSSNPEAICSVNCLKHDGSASFYVQTVKGSEQALADVVEQDAVVCPWESDIPGIAPRCKIVRVGPEHICSELTTLRQFGQWVAALDDGAGPLINLLTGESWVNFDPTAEQNLGRNIEFVQGNLRHVRAARPRWVVLVGRLPGDVPEWMK